MGRWVWPLATVVVLSWTGGSALAASRFVAPDGDDGSAGTEAQPWATLQHAVDTAAPGDTVLVKSGTYAGCRIERSGLPEAPSTLKAAEEASVLVNRPGPANRHTSNIEVESFGAVVRHWTIEGLEVANAPRYGIDLRGAEYVAVQNCFVHNSASTGILTAFSNYLVIEDNECCHNGEHGIYHSNSGDYPTIRGNRLHGNYGCGLHMNGDVTLGGDGTISYAIVEKNVIWDNGSPGGGSAINCDGVCDSVIRNNLCYGNHASGISLYAGNGAVGSSRNLVSNNTFVMADDSRWVVNIAASEEGKPNPTGNEVKNNILYTPRTDRGAITVYGPEGLAASDYNVVVSRFAASTEGEILSLFRWRGYGFDEHSLVATIDEVCADPAANDFGLKKGSPAIDAGMNLAEVSDDLEGSPRPQGWGWDIGCYEGAREEAPGAGE